MKKGMEKVMKKGKRKGLAGKVVIALVAIAIVAAGGYYAYLGSSIEVTAVPAAYGAIEKLITETGSVEARNSVVISSKIQGQLSSLDVSEGDTVKEGQRLATYAADSGVADIGSMRAQISGLQVQLNQANELAAKNKHLFDEGAVSFEEYNQATVEAKQIQSQIAAINYSIAGLSEAGGAKGVIAPISGTVTSVLVNEGEVVSPGAPMIEITDAEDTYIKVNLVSEDADEIAQGSRVRVLSENEKLIDENASVSKIFVKAQDVMSDLGISQKRVPVEITLGIEKNLRLGSNVNVEIISDMRENVLSVPENAVFEINRQQYVYVIEDGKAKLTSVQTGLEGEKYTEITSGLAEGDLVITSPAKEIEDGKTVKVL